MPINAIVTGSQKYGEPTPKSDVDVVVWVPDTRIVWQWSEEEDRAYFSRAMFMPDVDGEYAKVSLADDVPVAGANENVELGSTVVVVCGMSAEDEAIIGGLHKWVRTQDKHASFTSTYTNERVNLIPVSRPERWNLWQQGTNGLYQMSKKHGPVERQQAIDFFTAIGMPRVNS